MPQPREASTDADQAFDIFCDVLASEQAARTAIDLEYCRTYRHGKYFDARKMRANANARQKRRLGKILVRRYRDDAGVEGRIDWDKFKQWCKDHWKLILGIKIVLTVLFLFCL